LKREWLLPGTHLNEYANEQKDSVCYYLTKANEAEVKLDYLKIAREIIALDTSVPPGLNYGKAVDYLVPIFKDLGFEVLRIPIPPEHAEGREHRVNLVCHRRNPAKPRLIFYGHIDVVPAAGWDAFNPRIENGKIYGRGAADMKGSLVGLIAGLDEVREDRLNYDVSVMITTDEELSQASQLRYLRQFLEPVHGASVFSLDSSGGFVSIAGLGLLQVNLVVKGKSVHSGMAHLGDNAVEKAIVLCNALLELKQKVTARKSKVPTHPETGLSFMEARLNINQINGGIKTNIIPDECLISIDRRLIPEENIDTAQKELFDTINSVAGLNYEISSIFRIPTVPPVDDEVTDQLEEIIDNVTGETGKYGEMGSGDLGPIVNYEWGARDFGLGVIRTENNIHGKGEFVYQKDMEDLGNIIASFLTE
jgi:acetylornithine deacetylase/succinyl-diaminopimelate desuccinylase-like protein